MMTSAVLMGLGVVCCGLASALTKSPPGALFHTFPQLFAQARQGNLRSSSVAVTVLGLLGIGLVAYATWLSVHSR
jgi:hypothetical protein